jgi:hypothetical protein
LLSSRQLNIPQVSQFLSIIWFYNRNSQPCWVSRHCTWYRGYSTSLSCTYPQICCYSFTVPSLSSWCCQVTWLGWLYKVITHEVIAGHLSVSVGLLGRICILYFVFLFHK